MSRVRKWVIMIEIFEWCWVEVKTTNECGNMFEKFALEKEIKGCFFGPKKVYLEKYRANSLCYEKKMGFVYD